MAKIIVAGYMVRFPLAGNMLAFAQYLLGFQRLGHEVHYLEESGWPDSCYDPTTGSYTSNPSEGIKAASKLLQDIGCDCPITFVDSIAGAEHGAKREHLRQLILEADLIVNLGGVNWLEEFASARRIVLVDLDPMFTQIGSFAKEGFAKYSCCFTYGTNVGNASCKIPQGQTKWHPTVPPVVPDLWSGNDGPSPELLFTTIANWSAYGDAEWQGEQFGQKDQQFLKVLELPRLVDVKLRIAESGMSETTRLLFQEHGWEIVSAQQVTMRFETYRSFITASSGEFSVAKQGYVSARTGWISDRSVCYLAAGRPVVIEDTSVPSPLRDAPGWNTFSDIDSASETLNCVAQNYSRQRDYAIDLASTRFNYRNVLTDLFDRATR